MREHNPGQYGWMGPSFEKARSSQIWPLLDTPPRTAQLKEVCLKACGAEARKEAEQFGDEVWRRALDYFEAER